MDVFTTRVVVVALCVLCGVSLLGTVLLSAMGIQSPPALAMVIGSTFGLLIGIPIIPKAGRDAGNRLSRQPTHEGGVILAIDDSEGVRVTLERVFESEGYEIRTVASAEEGLRLLRTGFRPDLILLDMVLPGMDGNAFLAELKARKEDWPVIVLTGWPDHLEQGNFDRVAATVAKPPNVGELVAVVGSYLRKRSA